MKWPDIEESDVKLDPLLEDVREMFPDYDDKMHIRWHGDWSSWGDIRRDIHEYWPKYDHEDHTVVPMVEAVKVMRVRDGT
ncbi:hypothetical protein CEK25_000783 [Fusarium fujikuroi]|nr:hypothetical protein CEK25_000783 [Fusarium fujikuroi]